MLDIPPYIEQAIIQTAKQQGLTAIELLAKDYASSELLAEQYGIYSDDTHTPSQQTFERLNEWLDDNTPNPKLDALMAKYGGLSV